MNENALRWLLEPKDPFIRSQTLVDVLEYSPENKEAVEARRRIPFHPTFKRIMAGQTQSIFWPRMDTCDSPRFTGALWALMLLGDVTDICWKIAAYGSD